MYLTVIRLSLEKSAGSIDFVPDWLPFGHGFLFIKNSATAELIYTLKVR